MSSAYENRKQIVDTWVKLERCLDDFDAEAMVRKNRPMSSFPAPNKFQISSKRPDSSKFGYSTAANISTATVSNFRETSYSSPEDSEETRLWILDWKANNSNDRYLHIESRTV